MRQASGRRVGEEGIRARPKLHERRAAAGTQGGDDHKREGDVSAKPNKKRRTEQAE